MASSTALTWSSSSLLQSFGATTTTKAPERSRSCSSSTVMKVVCQRKVKKIRQVCRSQLPQIIMKENVDKVGMKGELVNVRAGFFRNFLLPLGKASMVTPAVLKEMKMEQDRIEAEKKRVKEEAQQLASVFESIGSFKVKRKSGGKGKQIFGSVTTQDLVDIIKAQLQRDIDKKIVSLPEIRETGEYIAELKLHPDVTARIRLSVYAN